MEFRTDENGTPWPVIWEYAIRYRCPRCKAEPMQPCNAPRCNLTADRLGRKRESTARLHVPRIDQGYSRLHRDRGKAPLTRIPGVRYDSLPREEQP
jgi:hypothetical protein